MGLRVIYAPMKLFKTKNRIVYLSRQSNEKSLDMTRLEKEIKNICPDTQQVFRLRMIPDGIGEKISYCLGVLGDMYYLATSKVAVLDTYSISVSCLKHKDELKVIQMWHASGAVKKFGLQCLGTKEGRDEKISRAMCMHENYDYVIAPGKATAAFYMEAFGCKAECIKLCSLPRIDELLEDTGSTSRFFRENPDLSQKKIVLYLPTFRDGEAAAVKMLKKEFENQQDYHLIVSTHPLFSKVEKDDRFYFKGDFSTYDLLKAANAVITDYSACAFDACVLMKPLYFFVPDYDRYSAARGMNIDLKNELPKAVFEDAGELLSQMKNGEYDYDSLYSFKTKYMEKAGAENSKVLAKFIAMLLR